MLKRILIEHIFPSICGICKSVMHWVPQFPDNTLNTYLSSRYPFDPHDKGCDQECDIVLFQTDFDYPSLISGLLAESCSDRLWSFQNSVRKSLVTVHLETIPDYLSKLVCCRESKRVFKFGDWQRVTSEDTVSLPVVIW